MNVIDYYISTLDLIFLFSATFLLLLLILNSKKLWFRQFIALAVILRVVLLLCDMYHLFSIPNLGADSEFFHYLAVTNQNNAHPRYITNYSVFLTSLYSFTNSSRVVAQFVNVLFGIGVIIFSQKCLLLFNIEEHLVKVGTLILCFEPNLIIFSAGLLREAWVEFFVSVSLYYFLLWYKNNSQRNFLLSLIFLLLGSYMHAGVIGIAVGYFLVYTLYHRGDNSFKFNARSWFAIFAIIIFVIFLSQNMGVFGEKMAGMDAENADEVIVARYEKSEIGGSDYLQWLPVTDFAGALLFSPLKMFYFLFSPVPWEWRGIQDLLAFVIDSGWYCILCWAIFRSKANSLRTLKRGLILSLLCVVFIFGIGVSNAGTAMRHRAKILSLVVVTYCVSLSSKVINSKDYSFY